MSFTRGLSNFLRGVQDSGGIEQLNKNMRDDRVRKEQTREERQKLSEQRDFQARQASEDRKFRTELAQAQEESRMTQLATQLDFQKRQAVLKHSIDPYGRFRQELFNQASGFFNLTPEEKKSFLADFDLSNDQEVNKQDADQADFNLFDRILGPTRGGPVDEEGQKRIQKARTPGEQKIRQEEEERRARSRSNNPQGSSLPPFLQGIIGDVTAPFQRAPQQQEAPLVGDSGVEMSQDPMIKQRQQEEELNNLLNLIGR